MDAGTLHQRLDRQPGHLTHIAALVDHHVQVNVSPDEVDSKDAEIEIHHRMNMTSLLDWRI